jgi:hypothetical protein
MPERRWLTEFCTLAGRQVRPKRSKPRSKPVKEEKKVASKKKRRKRSIFEDLDDIELEPSDGDDGQVDGDLRDRARDLCKRVGHVLDAMQRGGVSTTDREVLKEVEMFLDRLAGGSQEDDDEDAEESRRWADWLHGTGPKPKRLTEGGRKRRRATRPDRMTNEQLAEWLRG